ncbi:hypothetical protein L1887_34290 [Cichorium endivia]|nr:hypothetical protein L1887_34290 [Cichorium endivia]
MSRKREKKRSTERGGKQTTPRKKRKTKTTTIYADAPEYVLQAAGIKLGSKLPSSNSPEPNHSTPHFSDESKNKDMKVAPELHSKSHRLLIFLGGYRLETFNALIENSLLL